MSADALVLNGYRATAASKRCILPSVHSFKENPSTRWPLLVHVMACRWIDDKPALEAVFFFKFIFHWPLFQTMAVHPIDEHPLSQLLVAIITTTYSLLICGVLITHDRKNHRGLRPIYKVAICQYNTMCQNRAGNGLTLTAQFRPLAKLYCRHQVLPRIYIYIYL